MYRNLLLLCVVFCFGCINVPATPPVTPNQNIIKPPSLGSLSDTIKSALKDHRNGVAQVALDISKTVSSGGTVDSRADQFAAQFTKLGDDANKRITDAGKAYPKDTPEKEAQFWLEISKGYAQ